MRFVIFFQDGLGITGGAPGEIQGLAEEWGKSHDVVFLSRSCDDTLRAKPFSVVTYDNRAGIDRAFEEACSGGLPDFVLLVGFFIRDNPRAFSVAKRLGLPVVLHPAAHLMNETFGGKIFVADPNVRSLEHAARKGPSLLVRLKVAINPLLKWGFARTVGRRMIKESDLFAVLSRRCREEIKERFGIPDQRFLILRWGMDSLPQSVPENGHYFRDRLGFSDDIPNFVYWGRIEWRYKGLDRLLNGVATAVRNSQGPVPFRLFLIGPDYRGGAETVSNWIRDYRLAHVVHLIGPDRYTSGSKRPLIDADASVCLSRWDGFPRALRESVHCGKPIIASAETHFAELLAETGAGIPIRNADDSSEVARALIEMTDASRRDEFSRNTSAAIPKISYSTICGEFIADVASRLPKSNAAQSS